jgi:hypothetical protein
MISRQLYVKDIFRGELAIKPRNRSHGEGGSSGPEMGHPVRWPISGTSYEMSQNLVTS